MNGRVAADQVGGRGEVGGFGENEKGGGGVEGEAVQRPLRLTEPGGPKDFRSERNMDTEGKQETQFRQGTL